MSQMSPLCLSFCRSLLGGRYSCLIRRQVTGIAVSKLALDKTEHLSLARLVCGLSFVLWSFRLALGFLICFSSDRRNTLPNPWESNMANVQALVQTVVEKHP